MAAEVTETTADIRGVLVRLVEVNVAGHIVEQVLLYEVAEAEAEYGPPFTDKMDRYIQMGLFATDRIAADGTIGREARATSYVLDGKCIRTRKIEHCEEIAPGSAYWTITRPDGSKVHPKPWSCVPGTPPRKHSELVPTASSAIAEYGDFSEYA